MPNYIPTKDGWMACGVVDEKAKFPERVHYDCKTCTRILRELLESRGEQPIVRDEPVRETRSMFDAGTMGRLRKIKRARRSSARGAE